MTLTPTRRELNKTRTREAITAALRDLAAHQPVADITVEELANAAGISRRTFFNYFPGIASVVSAIIGEYTTELAGRLDGFGQVASPLEGLRNLLRESGLPVGLLQFLALLNCHRTDKGDADTDLERQVWSDQSRWLQGYLRDQLGPATDEIYIATLAASVMTAFEVTERAWVQTRPAQARLTAKSIADFHDLLDQALAYAARGWTRPTAT